MAGQAHPGQQARGSRNSRAVPEAVGCLVHQEALKQWQRTAAGLGRESLPAISHWQWLVPGSRLCRGGSPWVENAACTRALSSQAAENQASKAPSQHQRERNKKRNRQNPQKAAGSLVRETSVAIPRASLEGKGLLATCPQHSPETLAWSSDHPRHKTKQLQKLYEIKKTTPKTPSYKETCQRRAVCPFRRCQVDFTRMPRVGRLKYLLVIACQLTGWPEAFPSASAITGSVIKAFFGTSHSKIWHCGSNRFRSGELILQEVIRSY